MVSRHIYWIALPLLFLGISCSPSREVASASSASKISEPDIVFKDDLVFFTRVASAIADNDAASLESLTTDKTKYIYGYSSGEGGTGARQRQSTDPQSVKELLALRTWPFKASSPKALSIQPIGSSDNKWLVGIEAKYDRTGEEGRAVELFVIVDIIDGKRCLNQIRINEACRRSK